VERVNPRHEQLCSSPGWAEHLQTEILPRLTADIELGQDLIELGPGFGAATDWLRHRVRKLTAVEVDRGTARALADRYSNSNVRVVVGDGIDTGLEPSSYDSAASFTMLHHVPTAAKQFAVLARFFELLRPGGVLIGSDSLAGTDLHEFHEGDVYNPVDPARLLIQLQIVGFSPVSIRVGQEMSFTAHKPKSNGRS
jgi:SAM-dependent methyltransferase